MATLLIEPDELEKVLRPILTDESCPLHIAAEIDMNIDMMPKVDAVPVVHGHWKEDMGGYGFWICSHCGFVSEASGADILYRYCPNCGVRMDGKDGNHETD